MGFNGCMLVLLLWRMGRPRCCAGVRVGTGSRLERVEIEKGFTDNEKDFGD